MTQQLGPSHTDRWERVMLPNYGTPQLQLVRGKGAHLIDVSGKEYLDLLAGLAVNILGHAHPAVASAVCTQVTTLGHTSNLYANEPALKLAERLSAKGNGRRVLLVNSGTEANEAAYKMVRRYAHDQGMPDAVTIAFTSGFHGRTIGALALTGQPHYHEGFTPFMPGIVHVPYNDPVALENVFDQNPVAGVFAEFVQGEGGVTPMTSTFARVLSRLCQEYDALLVADEVQTGVGRTGRFFAHEHFGVEPHVITLAKGIGGGLPVGALLANESVAKLMGPGSHGCTFGGNPICAAAANAVLDVLEHEGLVARADYLGSLLAKEFTAALEAQGITPRGLGLLQGIPLPKPLAPEVVQRALEGGIIVGQAGKSVVRLAPPLIIEEDDLLGAVPALAETIAAVLE